MKIIDKTPLLDEKGNLGFVQQIQAVFRFGFNWAAELQAQKVVITFFERNLEKGYTLIHNQTLGQSDIMIPIILLGPAGIFVINLVYLRGHFQAKGDSWNVQSGNQFKPAPVNLIHETARLARALQVFIERQGVKLPMPVEPVLIAGDPGLHIESVKPDIKVMMIDGVKSFISGLGASGPLLNAAVVNDYVERIINPRPPRKEISQPRTPSQPRAALEQESPPLQQNVSRARAIFNASEEVKPFDPADFAMAEDEFDVPATTPVSRESSPAIPRSKPKGRRILGMTSTQFAIVAALGLCLICILVVGIVYLIPAFT